MGHTTEAKAPNKPPNKALHPTAYSFGFPLVPRSKPALPAAGELGVNFTDTVPTLRTCGLFRQNPLERLNKRGY